MFLKIFPSGPFATNTYLLGCPATKTAVVIDSSPSVSKTLIPFVEREGWTIQGIWLTHSHWDHIADVAPLKKHWNIPVFVHPEDMPNMKSPGADGLPCWIAIEPVLDLVPIQENDSLSIGDISFQVIHTPGHTPGGVCFFCPQEKVLLAGDTLFKGTIGNLSFPTSDEKKMWQSLHKLAKLPPETVVFPGHGPSTTIEDEPWLDNAEDYFKE